MTKPEGREVRVAVDTWPLADMEIRAEGDGMTFRGYAAVFNSWSEDLGGFREQIAPGAFTRSLKRDRNLRMFLNHNSDSLLATTRAKTLTLTEDDKGLLAEASLPDTSLGRDTAELLRRGDIDSMSFGFMVDPKGQKWSEDGAERTLTEIRLFEVSPVTGWPAYPATSASVRELAEAIEVAPDELAAAFAVLRTTDGKLTEDQHRLLVAAVNSRFDKPLRRAFTPEDEAIYRAFSAALS